MRDVLHLRWWSAVVGSLPRQIERAFERWVSLSAFFGHFDVDFEAVIERTGFLLNRVSSFLNALVLNETESLVHRTACMQSNVKCNERWQKQDGRQINAILKPYCI